jgi:hypothetical protein
MLLFLWARPTPLSFPSWPMRPAPLLSLSLPLPAGAHLSETPVPPCADHAFLTAPTLRVPPLTRNLAAPPTPSPPLCQSRHRAPSSYFFNWARPLPLPHPRRAAGVPRGNVGHRSDFLCRRPLTRRGLSATPLSRHLIVEPPPMAPCMA